MAGRQDRWLLVMIPSGILIPQVLCAFSARCFTGPSPDQMRECESDDHGMTNYICH